MIQSVRLDTLSEEEAINYLHNLKCTTIPINLNIPINDVLPHIKEITEFETLGIKIAPLMFRLFMDYKEKGVNAALLVRKSHNDDRHLQPLLTTLVTLAEVNTQ